VSAPAAPLNRGMITVSVMLATVMQVVDTTIVNVALPHMQGGMSATQEQIAWVLTSYIVAAAIFTPLTGVLAERFGRKRLFGAAVIGFTAASMLCGAATSLTEIVVYRALQGAVGASLVPLSQAVLLDVYPREKHGSAMALWGVGVMVGPILGPTLGGWLTEYYSWRWAARLRLLRFRAALDRDRRAAAHARPRQRARLVRLDGDRARGRDGRARVLHVPRAHVHGREAVHRAGAVRRPQLRRGAFVDVHGGRAAARDDGAAAAVSAESARLSRDHGRLRAR
jgi:hypothetical protein